MLLEANRSAEPAIAHLPSADPATTGANYHHVYTPGTLAERWKCSSTHVRNMIQRGVLAGFKYGGKLLRITATVVVAHENANKISVKR